MPVVGVVVGEASFVLSVGVHRIYLIVAVAFRREGDAVASGDQEDGSQSSASWWVRRVMLCPSASITYTCLLPSRSDQKAMR